MIKCIALLRKRADITREQFIDYYENNHSRLMSSLLPGVLEYRRNYVDQEGAFTFEVGLDFDVVTELVFKDRAAYDEMVSVVSDPEIARRIAEDEENLFDRPCSRMFIVDVIETAH